jgi:predicted DCC family thiol-disulfide oxidoreductase YuxK
MPVKQPTLLFDGDCGICRSWVAYWQQLTNGSVLCRAYQEAAAEFPSIPQEALKRAIWLIEPDGQAYSGAAASFRVLRHARGHGGWWWMYRRLPGFAAASEWGYAFLARHRGLLSRITRLLWGRTLEPEQHLLVSEAFLRLLGAIYAAAFASLGVQILGLVGHAGILPLGEYLSAAREGWGAVAYWRLPTVFWITAGDRALVGASVLGGVLGLCIMLRLWMRPALIGAFVLYLSLVHAGQVFTNYQWDQLLLESGFLAIFLTAGSRITVWLYRWLLFRFLFLSGAVKLVSGDPAWRHLTALEYHFWTQPLPAPLAWYAARLPHALLAVATAATLVIEVGCALLVFLPRRPRAVAALAVLLLQLAILLTGNYGFFNLLTVLLCLFLLDDAGLRRLLPVPPRSRWQAPVRWPSRASMAAATALALIAVPVGLDRICQGVARRDLPLAGELAEAVSPLQIVNRYGPFMTTTTTRPEIIIQGSDDGRIWREYVFREYPGPLDRAPSWNIPHQPRLDWQMWFAAYEGAGENPWFSRLLQRLLEGSPPVVALLAADPFAGRAPTYVRALLYDYRFADPDLRARTGQWWVRRPAGLYFPEVGLGQFLRAPRQ